MNGILLIILEIILFIAIFEVAKFAYTKIKDNKSVDAKDYLPMDEVHSLRQIFYLVLMVACFINFVYTIFGTDLFYLSLFDIALSLYCCVNLYERSPKGIIIFILLMPLGSLSYVFSGLSILFLLDLIHIPIFVYLIKIYYDKFTEYTNDNGLGLTILLLFIIVFISFVVTSFAEDVHLLDALVMTSNAFTSNGYTVLGHSIIGKLDSLVLVWGGYILSGVGTATLTAAILTKHFNKRFDDLEKLIKEEKKDN